MPSFIANLIHEPNPVFLKEVRQAVRGFSVPLVLLIELLVLTVLTGFWLYGRAGIGAGMEEAAVGKVQAAVDGSYCTGLILVSWVAGWSLVTLAVKRQIEERQSASSGLVFLTHLTVGRHLRGLWLAGLAVGLQPLLLALPFGCLYCWISRMAVGTLGSFFGAGIVVMGFLLALIMAGSATTTPGAQAQIWRRSIVPVSLFFGLLLPFQFGIFFYIISRIPRGLLPWGFGHLWVLGLLVAAGSLALAYGVAWAQLTIQVMPNSRSARWSRRGLQGLMLVVLGVVGIPMCRDCWQDAGCCLALLLGSLLAMIGAFSCWKIQRLGHAAQDGLWVSLCRAAGRRLAHRQAPAPITRPALEKRPEPLAGGVWLKLDFIDRWPLFDAANPILVKDLRQGLRNLVLPVLALLAFASGFLGLIKTDAGRFYGQGEYGLTMVMLLACWLFIAISLLADRTREEAQADSRDLLFATPLTPEQIVNGKWGMLTLAVAVLLLATLPHALIWGVLTGQLSLALGVMVGLGCLSLLMSLALLLLGLFPVNRTVFQLAVLVPITIFPVFVVVLEKPVRKAMAAIEAGVPWWWIAAGILLGALLLALLGDCLFQLAIIVARQRHDIARWLALLTLGQLPVLLLLISVMVADMTYGVAWFFLAALFSLLLIGQAWRAWNWRWRKRRLAAGGGG